MLGQPNIPSLFRKLIISVEALQHKCVKLINLLGRPNNKKLMKRKALRKHSLHEKTAASVLLKLFISGNE